MRIRTKKQYEPYFGSGYYTWTVEHAKGLHRGSAETRLGAWVAAIKAAYQHAKGGEW